MKRFSLPIAAVLAVGGVLGWLAASSQMHAVVQAEDQAPAATIDRTSLPIKEPVPPFVTELDLPVRESFLCRSLPQPGFRFRNRGT